MEEYGYGHTKEASKIVRETLKKELAKEIKQYNLKISVKKADSGYGGPRVDISSDNENFTDYYEYIVDENGEIADQGKLVRTEISKTGRWDHRMQLRRAEQYNEIAKKVTDKIKLTLSQFGKNEDDAMTDYFHNTSPLFYGVNR